MNRFNYIVLLLAACFSVVHSLQAQDVSPLKYYIYVGDMPEGFFKPTELDSSSVQLLKAAILGQFDGALLKNECSEIIGRLPSVRQRMNIVRAKSIKNGNSEFFADSIASAEIANNWPYCSEFNSKKMDLIYWAGIQNINIVSTLDKLDSNKLDQDVQYAIEFYRARWYNNESELIMQSVENGMSRLINKSVYYPTINKVLGKLYYLSNQTSFEYLKGLLSTKTRIITESHAPPNPIEPVILKDLQYYYPYLFKITDEDNIKNAAYYLDELILRIDQGEEFKSTEVVKFW